MRCAAAVAAMFAASIYDAGAQNDSPAASWLDPAIVESRGVDLRLAKEGRVTVVDAAIKVDASAEAIWRILVACDIAPEYVPNVVACQSIDKLNSGRSELFIQTVKPAFFIPSFEHVFRMDYEPYRRIEINRVSGPIRLLRGIWWLSERPDGAVLLQYNLTLDPGIPVPRIFVRTTLRRDLPIVLTAIRDRAERGIDP